MVEHTLSACCPIQQFWEGPHSLTSLSGRLLMLATLHTWVCSCSSRPHLGRMDKAQTPFGLSTCHLNLEDTICCCAQSQGSGGCTKATRGIHKAHEKNILLCRDERTSRERLVREHVQNYSRFADLAQRCSWEASLLPAFL